MKLTTTKQFQGLLEDRYDIYVSCVPEGEYVKTFDEWLNT